MTWYVVAEEPDANPEDAVWTLSERPDREGWNTDSGFNGYGLTFAKSKHLADAANAAGV